ncbi:STAS domain-containing protein [Streptomyces sp. NPDC051896]|uniref:STAS domain-containing protein n=1 Tax=Streptomyces sp. NPDC051896 TaxID=3155416 RepID=UPI00342AD359
MDRRDASLSLSWRPERGWLIVNAAGELSMTTRAEPRAYLTLVTSMPGSDPSRLVIDVSRVTACDAMELGALFGAHLRAACYGGRLHLVCPEGPLLHVLDVTGLRQAVPVTRPWLRRCPLPSHRRPGRRAR